MWIYTHKTVMVSLPHETKPAVTPFCFYRFLILSRKSVKRVSQNLDNISFTSNYIKYLEFTTAVSTVLVTVLKMEDLKKKKKKKP